MSAIIYSAQFASPNENMSRCFPLSDPVALGKGMGSNTFIYMFNLLSNCFGHRQTAIKSLTFDFKLWDLFEINWLTFKWSPDDRRSDPFKVWPCVTGGERWFSLRLRAKRKDWSISVNRSSGLHTMPVNNHWVQGCSTSLHSQHCYKVVLLYNMHW